MNDSNDTKPDTFADQRDRAAEACLEAYMNGDCFGSQESVQSANASFKAGADWGYAKGRATYSASELEMAKYRAQEKRASLFGELVVKEEIDRLKLELAEVKKFLDATTGDAMCARAERDELRARLERAEAASEHRYKWAMAQQSRADHALAALEYAKRAIEHEDLSFPHAEESVLAEIERILGES